MAGRSADGDGSALACEIDLFVEMKGNGQRALGSSARDGGRCCRHRVGYWLFTSPGPWDAVGPALRAGGLGWAALQSGGASSQSPVPGPAPGRSFLGRSPLFVGTGTSQNRVTSQIKKYTLYVGAWKVRHLEN